MTIRYIKKADKTAASDELETRQRVQVILKEIDIIQNTSREDFIIQKMALDLYLNQLKPN